MRYLHVDYFFRSRRSTIDPITFALVAALICILVVGGAAYAQDSTKVGVGGTYEFLRPYILDLVGIVVSAALGWISILLYKWFGIKLTDSDRGALQMAATNGAGRILARIQGPVDQIKFDLGNPEVNAEANRVQSIMADEIKRLNLSPDRVREIVLAKVGLAQQGNVLVPAAPAH